MIKEKLNKVNLKAQQIALAGTIAVRCFNPLSVSAGSLNALDTNSVTVVAGTSDTDIISGLIGVVLGLFQLVGIFMTILGVAQFVMNSHEDQVDKRLKSITVAGCGLLLISLRQILRLIGVIS